VVETANPPEKQIITVGTQEILKKKKQGDSSSPKYHNSLITDFKETNG
jgi:hypothetical protein